MNETMLNEILRAIDAANACDPAREPVDGEPQPRELVYGRRMSRWLEQLRPDADPALQIAARAQHICRWEHPRDEYPMDRKGYLAWRRALYTFHAEKAAGILREFNVDPALIERVSFLLHKKNLHNDPDTQTLEDAACLVFLEYYIAEFAARTGHEKTVGIVRKTWRKMSGAAREHAVRLPYTGEVKAIIDEALADG